MPSTKYDDYVRAEWDMFLRSPERARATLEAVSELKVIRVLDLACGAGQELLPFVTRKGTLAVGLDISPEIGRAGPELINLTKPEAKVFFVQGAGEALPFHSESFDVVICRLALPYMKNVDVIAEIARTLRPAGVLLLKYHHLFYYLLKLWRGKLSGDTPSSAYAKHVLIEGTKYLVTGKQPTPWYDISETFQTKWTLQKKLKQHGLAIRRTMPDSSRCTPSYLITKRASSIR
jgi:ubiquinone/menaquinone biosynthesis C-methylase UbiE